MHNIDITVFCFSLSAISVAIGIGIGEQQAKTTVTCELVRSDGARLYANDIEHKWCRYELPKNTYSDEDLRRMLRYRKKAV